MVGGDVLAGAVGAATTAVASDVALPVPNLLVALTTTRSVLPMSAERAGKFVNYQHPDHDTAADWTPQR